MYGNYVNYIKQPIDMPNGSHFGGAMELCGHGLPLMRAATDHLFREGRLLAWVIPATGVLVETLLDRGADGDVDEADTAIARLAAAPANDRLVIRDIWLLRLRALLARLTAMPPRISRLATETWRKRLVSRGISRGPRRCDPRNGLKTRTSRRAVPA
jgi:hypothetical protein